MKAKSKKSNLNNTKKENFFEKYKRHIPTIVVLVLVTAILIYLAVVREDTLAGEAIKNTIAENKPTMINSEDLSVVMIPASTYTTLPDGTIQVNTDNLDQACVCSGCGYDCSCSQGCEVGCPSCN
jgi:hypothetical protein